MYIETKRLILRNFKEEDLDDLYAYLSNEEVVQYEPYTPRTYEDTMDDLYFRMRSNEFIAVELKENHHLIGNLYIGENEYDSAELGYIFNQDYWHQGYAYEACLALMDEKFKAGMHRIFAECDPENKASYTLLERLGFQREAYLKENIYFFKDENGNPIWKDTYIYSLLGGDYFEKSRD